MDLLVTRMCKACGLECTGFACILYSPLCSEPVVVLTLASHTDLQRRRFFSVIFYCLSVLSLSCGADISGGVMCSSLFL